MRVLEMGRPFWLVTTDHLTDRIWFRDEEDFRVGMNLVAILACTLPVEVYAFILMSNHLHFVIACTKEVACHFINEYKRRYAQYAARKYGTKELLRKNGVDIRPVEGNDESLEWTIAYVQMNSVAANICLNAADYPWGTGSVFFKVAPSKGRRLDSFSGRARTRLLHSEVELPSGLKVGEGGYILPESYVCVERVEALFRTPRRMNYFLQNSSKAKRRLSADETGVPAFRDQVIQAAVPDLCQSLFRKRSVTEMETKEQAELLKQLRFRFSAQVNQLARVTGLSYETAAALLEGM